MEYMGDCTWKIRYEAYARTRERNDLAYENFRRIGERMPAFGCNVSNEDITYCMGVITEETGRAMGNKECAEIATGMILRISELIYQGYYYRDIFAIEPTIPGRVVSRCIPEPCPLCD